jgi:hypothetical protein
MKRRDFLLRSAGTAGLLLPVLGRVEAAPCPPPALSEAKGSSVTGTCAASNGTAPAWFVNMQDRTWATPVSNLLSAVRPSGVSVSDQNQVCDAWTGASVDQSRGEYIFAAQGGHGTYAGNEIYSCNLRNASPAWSRVWGASASVSASGVSGSGGDSSLNGLGNYADGQPRCGHGYAQPASGNGKIWLAGISGMASSNGYWTTATYSFDRATQAWTYWGKGSPNAGTDGTNWEGAPAVVDTSTGTVWAKANGGDSNGLFSCTTAGVIRTYNLPATVAVSTSGNGYSGFHAIIGRYWVCVGTSYGTPGVYVLNLDSPASGWTQCPLATSGTAMPLSGGWGVYHAASRAFICWNNSGANLYKLSVPANPAAGTYTWQGIVTPNSGGVTPSSGSAQGTFGKFNIINDMGNGQSALVLTNRNTDPTYVYKIPASGV